MSKYIDAEKLYNKCVELEEQAREQLQKYNPKDSLIECVAWQSSLSERTIFKHIVMDMTEKIDDDFCSKCERGN